MKANVAKRLIYARHCSKGSSYVAIQSLKQASQIGAKIVPILEMRKVRHREAK